MFRFMGFFPTPKLWPLKPFKGWKMKLYRRAIESLAPRTKHKIFELKQKQVNTELWEYRISFQKQKKNATFYLQNYDLWKISKGEQCHFAGAMSSQATAWHHITGHRPESLLVKLKY